MSQQRRRHRAWNRLFIMILNAPGALELRGSAEDQRMRVGNECRAGQRKWRSALTDALSPQEDDGV